MYLPRQCSGSDRKRWMRHIFQTSIDICCIINMYCTEFKNVISQKLAFEENKPFSCQQVIPAKPIGLGYVVLYINSQTAKDRGHTVGTPNTLP